MNDSDEEKNTGSLISVEDIFGLGTVGKRIVTAFEKVGGPPLRRAMGRADADAAREMGKARADNIREVAKAVAEAENILAGSGDQRARRAAARLANQAVREQENIESVFRFAIDESREFDAENRSEAAAEIDNEWMVRFVRSSQDVGKEDMQRVWARVLACEAHKPGTYSFRALSILQEMRTEEALKFQRFCHLSFEDGFVCKIGKKSSFEEFGITYDDILALRELGLVNAGDNLNVTIESGLEDKHNILLEHNGLLVSLHHRQKEEHKFNQVSLTLAGTELRSLVDAVPNLKYLRAFGEWIATQKYTFAVSDPETKSELMRFTPPDSDSSAQ